MLPEMIIVPAIFGIVAAVVSLRLLLRHREKMASIATSQSKPVAEERLERLEHAVEAIALEMERVGEGQRFLTKVLAERLPASGIRPGLDQGRVITPH
jgi:cytochrome c-type biogenesis protein CcmH/NrfG